MAKSRTLNEIRQSKEYQTALQGGDFIKPTDKPAKSTAEVMSKNPFEHSEVDKLVDKIADKKKKLYSLPALTTCK